MARQAKKTVRKKRTRKARTDSVAGQVAAFRTSHGISWPTETVTPMPGKKDHAAATRHFARILSARAAEHWPAAQIVHVARLSTLLVELDKVSQQIYQKGWLIEKEGRTGNIVQVPNPLAQIQQQLTTQTISISQKLGLCGTQADPRTVRNQGRLAPALASVSPLGKAPDWSKMLEEETK